MVQQELKMKYRDLQKDTARSTSPSTDSRIRRASYYVWFLGAEECRGLRGTEVVRPVVQYLVQKERDNEPEKVTLQVSGRGIKLLQQGATNRASSSGSNKHIIPAGAITHVQVEPPPDDDIVSTILLIYNPVTRCPVHVHCYRCDSTETAEILRDHLQQLLLRPEQQAKLAALEGRLASRGLLPSGGREGDGSSGSSISSGAGSGSGRPGERMTSLYDSLAAELREKLGARGAPLLLPPKDYEKSLRRGDNRKFIEDDSAKSSGIGSDDAPSPTLDRDQAPDHQSSGKTEEDDWGGQEALDMRGEMGIMSSHSQWHSRESGRIRSPSPRRISNGHRERSRRISPHNGKHLRKELSPLRLVRYRHHDRTNSPESPQDRFQDARDKFLSLERQRSALEASRNLLVPPELIDRSTSWEITPRAHYRRSHGGKKKSKDHHEYRDENGFPKSDRDTGYGSRDALKEKRMSRDYEPRDQESWARDFGRRTPDVWDLKNAESPMSPPRSRTRTPIREHRVPRVRSPDRHEYMRAKSMHDLSHSRRYNEEERRGLDPRRHSYYEPSEGMVPLKSGRRQTHASHGHLGRPGSLSSSSSSVASNPNYNELPDGQRFPGLDRATARLDPLEPLRSSVKKKYDYPMNGGHAPITITRAQHDDYRRFRYDHSNTSFMRSSMVGPHY